MNLSQLEHLVEFARTGNRLTAAENSFVTPQAISKSITNLSSELGVALSRKAGRDVEPTEAALKIAPFAESALQSISDMKSQAYRLTRVVAREGDVKIALSFTAFRGCPVGKDAFDQFALTHPDISVHIETYQNETCLLALYEGIVDAVIAMGKPINPDLECREVASPAPIVAIVGKDNPLSTREALTSDDLVKATVATPNDLRHGYSSLLSSMRKKGLSLNFKNIIETESAHRDFLDEGGVIFAFSNASLLNDAFCAKAVPLHPDVAFDCPVYLIFNSKINNSPLPLLADYLEVL